MRYTLPVLALAALAGLPFAAMAFDNGQYGDVPANVRTWFKNVRSPQGIPCCDMADGHRTQFEMRTDGYWVPIDGEWRHVPSEAIVQSAGNPVGEAVVWFAVLCGNTYHIRCFVPGSGA